jgi:hypothetical protein
MNDEHILKPAVSSSMVKLELSINPPRFASPMVIARETPLIATSTSSTPSERDRKSWEYSNGSDNYSGIRESWLVGRCGIENNISSNSD